MEIYLSPHFTDHMCQEITDPQKEAFVEDSHRVEMRNPQNVFKVSVAQMQNVTKVCQQQQPQGRCCVLYFFGGRVQHIAWWIN